MPSIPPRALAAALFVPDGTDYYQCRICFSRRKQAASTGYTNLVEHLMRQHAETYEDEFRVIQRREGSLDAFVKVDDFSQTIYHWLDWTIMENRELSMCEKVKTRKYTHLKPVCAKTLKKHMFGLEKVVQEHLKRLLSGRPIGLMLDAWTEAGTHFVAVIGVTQQHKVLLCFSTLENEADMSADSIIELLDDVLDTYGIDAAAQLSFYVCDNASVNVAIARETRVPMIGCASHRFNLAVQSVMEEYSEILEKLQKLMGKLNTIKNRHYLREQEALMPILRNTTRWSSTFAMVNRYLSIRSKLDRFDDELADVTPSARENIKLNQLNEDLKNFESVSMKLQSESGVTLRDARVLFDYVIKHYPATEEYLGPSARIVKFADFENGVVKLLGGEQQALTNAEQVAVAKLIATTEKRHKVPNRIGTKRSFADAALGSERYTVNPEDLSWIPCTSNDVERLFSRAGIVFSRLRRSMNPMTLESLMFLQYNRSHWDAAAVTTAIERSKAKKQRVDSSQVQELV